MQHGTRFARRTHWRSHAVARDAMMRRTAAHCGSACGSACGSGRGRNQTAPTLSRSSAYNSAPPIAPRESRCPLRTHKEQPERRTASQRVSPLSDVFQTHTRARARAHTHTPRAHARCVSFSASMFWNGTVVNYPSDECSAPMQRFFCERPVRTVRAHTQRYRCRAVPVCTNCTAWRGEAWRGMAWYAMARHGHMPRATAMGKAKATAKPGAGLQVSTATCFHSRTLRSVPSALDGAAWLTILSGSRLAIATERRPAAARALSLAWITQRCVPGMCMPVRA